jgi:hypothetical protein
LGKGINLQIGDLPSQNAIKSGTIYLKPGAVEEHISRSVRMVVLEDNSNPEYVGRRGTCTLLRRDQNRFIVCTRHQLGIESGISPSSYILGTLRFTSLNNAEFLTNIPVVNCIFETGNSDQEYHDLLIFRVQESWGGISQEAPYFYPLEHFHCKTKRKYSWVTGCPTSESHFEYGTQKKAEIRTVILNCTFDTSFSSKNEHYRRYKYDQPGREMDGLSGGSIFSMKGDAGDFEVVFDGIVVRAGQGHIHIVDADYLMRVVEDS